MLIRIEKRFNSTLEAYGISLGARHHCFFTSPFKIYEYQQLIHGANLKPSHNVLDFGCGHGRQTQLLARHVGKIMGTDISENSIERANRLLKWSPVKGRVEFRVGALEELDLPANSFDRILSFCVLEHVQNLPIVLLTMKRLLTNRGEIHVSVDSLSSISDNSIVQKHKSDHSVVQYFTSDSICHMLGQYGFEIMKAYPIMKGEFARREFEHRILNGTRQSIFGRMRAVKKMAEEDNMLDTDSGIMLIVRARKMGV